MKIKKFDEKRWQAESDANVLASYQEIMGDKRRMEAAVKVAKSRADELSKRADMMSRVYSMGGSIRMKSKNSNFKKK